MRRIVAVTVVSIALVFSLSACHKIPEHARYIPKDAMTVVGLDVGALGKKIAWNVITGSKLYQEMQSRATDSSSKNALDGLDNAGIDAMNTLFVYVMDDKRFNGGRVTGLVPLSDAGKWETYIRKVFPQINIKQQNGRKEALLTNNIYAGWTPDLLIIISSVPGADYSQASIQTDSSGNPAMVPSPARTVDETTLAAEMNNAFSVTKENSLVQNKHFSDLEGGGHDMTMWANYDQIMTRNMSNLSGQMGGFSLSNGLWKDMAATMSVDFGKGNITANSKLYVSPEIKDVFREFAGANADKDMIERLPTQNLDFVYAWHLSPKGTKDLLDKLGVLGFINIALSSQNMSADDIFSAFTGDMAVALNNFTLKPQVSSDTLMGEVQTSRSYKTSMDGIFVMKINKKENFDKLLQLAVNNGGLLKIAPNTFAMPVGSDSVYLLTSDKYAAITNRVNVGNGFISGAFRGQKLPATASAEVMGHPFGAFFNVQQMVKDIDPSVTHSAHDSAMIAEGMKLIDNISANGGEFKADGIESHLSINFMNKDENSILELMDFGMRMRDASGN